MSDLPIIFSAPMVRALLDGRKTMTRRLLKPQPEPFTIDDQGTLCEVAVEHIQGDSRPRVRLGRVITKQEVRWAVGDRLWVRENFWIAEVAGQGIGNPFLIYEEEFQGKEPNPAELRDGFGLGKWGHRPSIHMPRAASRLTLIVTAVKIEPLLDISEGDAKAEGFEDGRLNDGFGPRDIGHGWTIESGGTYASAAGMFQVTWTKLHPDWDGYSSPYVAAITFTVHKQNIDEIPKVEAA